MKTQAIGLLLIVLLAGSSTCFGQLDRASLSGVVSDPTGGVIPEAKVTVTHVDTAVSFSTNTNQSGVYNFSGLGSSETTGAAEVPGFKKAGLRGGVPPARAAVRGGLTPTPRGVDAKG